MTMNFTSYSTIPSPICSEDDFGSICWDRGSDGGGRDWTDLAELLPDDPFEMELTSNLAAAIAGLFEHHLEVNSNYYGLYCWNGAGGSCLGDELIGVFGRGFRDDDVWESMYGVAETSNSREPKEGLPHEGLVHSLRYLGVRDLLSVEGVCKSLRVAVQDEPLLWSCIHVDSQLNEKVTDDALLRLTQRAQGILQCLSLVGCSKITDGGLRKVLESNPRLQKLSVYGCGRLSVEGMISNLRAFKSSGAAGIRQLKLGRSFSVSVEQYEELQTLLGRDATRQPKPYKPRFYHCGVSTIACDDDRVLDIEMCSGCQKFKLVFDCPSESCQGKGSENCRACEVCIERCVQCGRCINDCRFVETFLLDYVCLACDKQTPSS